jgi:hypothetical protein
MNKKIKNKPIAFQDNTISIEDLPLPNVLYPGFYGSYFGFQESENSEVVFCSCAKKATISLWFQETSTQNPPFFPFPPAPAHLTIVSPSNRCC